MSNSATNYASPISPHVLYHQGQEFDGQHQGWPSALDYASQPPHMTSQSCNWSAESEHSTLIHASHQYSLESIDIAQPAPTRRIDPKYLESHSVSQSPEMVHPSVPQPQYHHHHHQQLVSWPVQAAPPAASGYEYDGSPYSGAHLEHSQLVPSGYYGVSQHAYFHGPNVPYSAFSPYAHMQPSSYCPPTYAQSYSTAVYGYPVITPPESRRNSYAPYTTPASSNPSSGNTSPQFESLEASQHEYDNVNSADGSEMLLTPITPSLHHQSYPGLATLLLAQPGITNEPIPMYHHHQEAFATFEARPAHHETEFQTPVAYLPLSPVSPVLEHPHATKEEHVETPVPATPPTQTTTFVVESGQPEEPLALLTETTVDGSAGVVQSQAQAAERLKKLRERRHVVACTFCRGRKIACHGPAPTLPTEAEDGIPPSVALSSHLEHDDEYKPKIGVTTLRRASSAAATERPPCENCIRRGRECVYPPRVPRVPRRRRKAGTAAPAQPNLVDREPPSPRYPVLSINTDFLQ